MFISYHGVIEQTGITCKKIPCHMPDSACTGVLLKILKYFAVMLNIFETFHVLQIVESWLIHANKFSWITKSRSLTGTIKWS